MMTTMETVMRVTPVRAAAAPTMAYVAGVTHGVSGAQVLKRKKPRALSTQISIKMPMARPTKAPIAMDGRMMPAGIWRPKVMVERRKPTRAANMRRTMVPADAAPVLHRPIWSSRFWEHSVNKLDTRSDA